MAHFGRPTVLVMEEALGQTRLARRLAGRMPRVCVVPGRIAPADYAGFGPETLVLASHPGRFLRPCPGTRGYNCCGLRIIHLGLGCSLGCSYCILQAYLETRALVLFGNADQGLDQLRGVLDQRSGPLRFCSGEFTDSLLLEDLTGLAARLVNLFAGYPQALLELKTKTDNVETLLDLDHGGRTVISFSVNAPAVAAAEEPRAAPLARRLTAARKAVQAGYRVGFHFDPLLRHPGWEEGYARVVADIFAAVPAERIAWLSLGAFRFMPRLKTIIARRHPRTRIIYDEFVRAPDGKMRYLRPLRVKMYRHLWAAIRAAAPEALVYLCMESPRVWQEVFGFDPGPKGLVELLDKKAMQ